MSDTSKTPHKSFEVTFTRMVSQSTVVHVEAADKKAATALGWEKFEKTRGELEWEDCDEDGTVERADTSETEFDPVPLLLPHADSFGDDADIVKIVDGSEIVSAYMNAAIHEARLMRVITDKPTFKQIPLACLWKAYSDCQEFVANNLSNLQRYLHSETVTMSDIGTKFFEARGEGSFNFENVRFREFGDSVAGQALEAAAIATLSAHLELLATGDLYFEHHGLHKETPDPSLMPIAG